MIGDLEQSIFANGKGKTSSPRCLVQIAVRDRAQFELHILLCSAWRMPLALTFRSPPDSGMMRGETLCIKARQTITRNEARSRGPPGRRFKK
jgi:hypothetical protein